MERHAKKELGENEEVRETNMREIKKWLVEQPFPKQSLSHSQLLSFLRGCKFNQQKTREKLTYYLQIRSSESELFRDRDPFSEALREIISRGIMLLSTSEDRQLVIVRWEHCDTKKVSLVNASKLGFMLCDITMNENPTCMIHGYILIIDCKNLPFGYVRQCSPTFLKELSHVVFKAYPTRIKGVHVVNCSLVVGIMFRLMRVIIPLKIISRIHFYNASNISDIRSRVPLSLLPKDYGGEGRTLDSLTDITKCLLKDKRSWFLKTGGDVLDS